MNVLYDWGLINHWLNRIIQRDIPKELDLVADQAQSLKSLLWDYDDLSQVKSQL